jgi:C4-dicarboxylate-specific signal transduction histidine kinase
MGVPIASGEHVHGYLSAVGQFGTSDARLALALAAQTALTLRWAGAYAAAVGKARRAERLIALEQRIRRSTDHGAALDLLLEEATSSTSASHGCILVSQRGRAVALARSGYTQEEASLLQQIPPSLDRGLTGQAFQSGSIVRSDDVLSDPKALPALASTRSQLVIPLRSADHTLGLIDLQSAQPRAFQSTDETWLLALSELASATIERQRSNADGDQTNDVIPQHDLLLSSRLAVVTDLAAGVAHEINNPLTTILGYTHLLLRDSSLAETTRNDISQIMVEGQRIAALVERFLRFAQPTSSGKRPLTINEPLAEALDLLKSRLQESAVQVELETPPDPPMVLGQAGQLEQVFVDLLQNAIEAMSTNGRRRIAIQVAEQNGWVRIAISDTGRGIQPDLLTRVFEPGFTTKVDKGISRGLGLGLYATHSIIRDHWGRIEVQSQVWQGSTFTVCLPAI